MMQRIRIKGTAAFQSTPAEYMRDMLRYDDGRIEAIWDYPTGKRFESVKFTAIVQLNGFTPDRWRSFGLYPDVLGNVGEYSSQGYTVDEWAADHLDMRTMAWQAVTGGLPSWEWWRSFRYVEDGTTWEVPGTLEVIAENPSDDRKWVTKNLTAQDMLMAYDAMPDKTHCGGCDLLSDPDECSSDLILQWAMYGEIVFG
jgi:hypothetical protein